MIICLSSGSSPRYRQDVIRALALPIGSNLQFRYEKRWVSDGLLKKIQDRSIVGQEVIIAYADQSIPDDGGTPKGDIQLVPVRLAKVTYAAVLGRTTLLIFSVGKFVFASDLNAFNDEAMNLTGKSLPKWVDGKPQGKYCTELSNRPTNFLEIQDLGQWEQVVAQLANRKDFEQERAFITVLGLMTEDEIREMGAELKHKPWVKELQANKNRELLIYHYYPTTLPTDLQITIHTGPELKSQSSPTCTLDSRYDLKRFHLESGDPPFGSQGSWINIILEGQDKTNRLEMEISVKVKGNQLRRIGIAFAIAIGLTGAQIGPLLTRTDLDAAIKGISALIIFVLSLGVGIIAVWKIRRNI